MTATDRRAELAAIVGRLVTARSLGDAYGYDVSPVIIPAPQGMAAGYLVVISCRSPVLVPPRMAHCQVIADAWPDEAALAGAVAACMDGLAQARAELLQVPAPAAAPPAGGNGSGLVRGHR